MTRHDRAYRLWRVSAVHRVTDCRHDRGRYPRVTVPSDHTTPTRVTRVGVVLPAHIPTYGDARASCARVPACLYASPAILPARRVTRDQGARHRAPFAPRNQLARHSIAWHAVRATLGASRGVPVRTYAATPLARHAPSCSLPAPIAARRASSLPAPSGITYYFGARTSHSASRNTHSAPSACWTPRGARPGRVRAVCDHSVRDGSVTRDSWLVARESQESLITRGLWEEVK